MCGPLLLAVAAARRRDPPGAAPRFSGGLVLHGLAHHGGRLVTYCLLGAVSGLIGAAVVFAGLQRWISIAAGCLVLLGTLTSLRARWGGVAGTAVCFVKTKLGQLLRGRGLGAAALLGGLNGLLPCGVVYVACAAAAAGGGVRAGVATMLAFGLGTTPVTLSISLAGKAFRWHNPLPATRVVLVCATAVGVLLIMRGLSLGIPYLSPHYLDGQGPACECKKVM
jgi:sulfite exporter TauE/SafE